jgi:hypothetical protein
MGALLDTPSAAQTWPLLACCLDQLIGFCGWTTGARNL